ncbi:glycosyltransferase family 2 protein [Kineococcus sp. SYSU DK005]|uniref:glycosyltransferase n=1 Tax=Kineococcus sp. SYSU DK005 TaxID=3383126 RepID=UPI003D7C7182
MTTLHSSVEREAATPSTRPVAPTVSVVVPVHDGVEDLRRCLAALLAQDYPPERVQVLVVDNASREDVSAALPDDERFLLLSEPVPGSYRARNRALARADGEVVAFTDADCTPEPDWLRRGVEALRRTGEHLAMVGGAVELTFPAGRPRTAWELYEAAHAFPQQRYLAEQNFAVTANLFTWRSALAEVGPFDAALRSRGDAEWGQRLAARGGAQGYAGAAVVHHPARSTWSQMCAKTLRVARGRRDVDLARGLGRRHFAGVAVAHARLAVRALVEPPVREGVLRTPLDRVRYLLAHTTARAVFVGVYLPCAWRPAPVTRGTGAPATSA